MSLQQAMQPRTSTNGFGRRRVDREMGSRLDSKSYPGRSSSSSFGNAGVVNGSKVGGFESPSRDRLIFLTACLIGHGVEVQVKNGSLFSGIFHATNNERDFGIILKMARLVKDGSVRGPRSLSDSVSKPPSKTLIIPANELVQIIAKDVLLSGDGLINGHACDKQQDILIDSFISQSSYVEERELERWAPDQDDPQCPELENIFDGPWNRKWDQFETNESLFGVKSTFDEELYTTKLERGPQMREIEREASRLAQEIEGEETEDLHLAEEKGLCLYDDFELDEETRYSSVFRGVDDGRYEETDDTKLDSRNTETFGSSTDSVIKRTFSDMTQRKSSDEAQVSPSCSMEEVSNCQRHAARTLRSSGSADQVVDRLDSVSISADAQSRLNESFCIDRLKDLAERKNISEEAQSAKPEDIHPISNPKKASLEKGGLSPSATAYAPSFSTPSIRQERVSASAESSELGGSGKGAKQPVSHRGRPGSSTSSTSECHGASSASSGPGLSPSSSVGSLLSEKSSLNPNAKEFKLNPNAKSFSPSSASFRPPAPGPEGSFYYPANVAAVPHMHGLPLGVGIGPSFGGNQPVVYSPQGTSLQTHGGYVHPSGPLYGQQMFVGQPRQVLYMPTYPHEMQYKGRDF
ncbi:polyadenylate-binding protein-interacting protein 3-like isoform X2 [Aristolochia californica]|uniref:polyadenylate-binding protein-interacting protein 3-like isoform X2 n=1 Tax=Aristolochia californica TaxID=171875 RepID=UPI0035D63110